MQYQYIPPDMSVVHVRHQQGKGPGEGGDACEEPGRRPVDEAPRGRCKAEMGSSRGHDPRNGILCLRQEAGRSQDWFKANATELNTVIEEKRAALLEHKRQPTQSTRQALRKARGKVQRTARRCANDYWMQFDESIHLAADTGKVSGVYDGIKKAIGPTYNKRAPLK